MSGIRSFEELQCWQASRALRLFVSSDILPKLPTDEKYRLADQLLRAARSSTANIAEGYGRYHYLDNAKFCSNARGSLWECLDHLITANDEAFISKDIFQQGKKLTHKAIQLINGYISYLQKASKSPSSMDAKTDNK